MTIMDPKTIRILIVEDSPTQAIKLEFALEERGFLVSTAFNGAQGLSMARQTPPALVITDIVMPQMDGYELCMRLKKDPNLALVPVILLTSLSDPGEVLRAMSAGADSFLTKPYDDDFLVDRIIQLMRTKELRASSPAEGNILPVVFGGKEQHIPIQPARIVDLLLSIYEDAVIKQQELAKLNNQLSRSLEMNSTLQANYLNALYSTTDALVIVGSDGLVKFANRVAIMLFDKQDGDFVGGIFEYEIFDKQLKEIVITHDRGNQVVTEMQVSRTYWEGTEALLASLRDVTDKVKARDELKSLAFSDELTGLLNRRGLVKLAQRQLESARQVKRGIVVFFCDLDGMKWINDNLGHEEGDRVLVDTATVLRATFRKLDVIGRLGGDEFTVVTMELNKDTVSGLSTRLQRNVEIHNSKAGRKYTLALSVGTVVSDPLKEEAFEDLLVKADKVMYEIKKARKRARGERPE
jgi:diguanylate cyclase (GGDEF)-like protein